MKRRNALKFAASLGLSAMLPQSLFSNKRQSDYQVGLLQNAINETVLDQSLFAESIEIEKVEALKFEGNFIIRVTSKEGIVGEAIGHNTHLKVLYPILTQKIIPHFMGKDARRLEEILETVYRASSNYKFQGLAFWVPLASVEFAVLDLLGKKAGVPVGRLFGKIYHKEIAVYRANNHRGKSAEESVELIQKSVEETGAKAVKYKVGGRMSKNQDDPPGRTEKLIPLVREKLGSDITIYADSNGSYDVENAVRIGRMLEETKASFFEEPCPFDDVRSTRAVADALDIPIAGGEQDSSLNQFQWMIENDALQIVQPDLFYFGGMIRAMKVARMAAAFNKPCTPHISGTGLGYLYMLHFVSALSNAGPYHEFKGINKKLSFECPTSNLDSKNGVIKVPTDPGLGIRLDKKMIESAERL